MARRSQRLAAFRCRGGFLMPPAAPSKTLSDNSSPFKCRARKTRQFDPELIPLSPPGSRLTEIRFQRDVETIDALGSTRVCLELLELGRRHRLQTEIAAVVAKYAGIAAELLGVTGGDQMVPLPVHLVVR